MLPPIDPIIDPPPIEDPLVPLDPAEQEPVPDPAPDILTHTVAPGENLADIAALLGVSGMEIMADNRLLSPEEIVPGMALRVAREGALHLIREGETLTDIAHIYDVSVEEIAAANDLADPALIITGEELLIPRGEAFFWEDVVRLARGERMRFIWPLEGEVRSEFGWSIHPVLGTRHHHNGIDIAVPTGTSVHAAASGRVFFVGGHEELGTILVLSHADGFYTIYGHLATALVSVGRFVEVGEKIAESGETGLVIGPQLYFEIRNREFPVDPRRHLP